MIAHVVELFQDGRLGSDAVEDEVEDVASAGHLDVDDGIIRTEELEPGCRVCVMGGMCGGLGVGR